LWDDCDDAGVRQLLQLGPAHVAEIAMTDVTLHPPPAPLQTLLAALDQTCTSAISHGSMRPIMPLIIGQLGF
jgi:hypothetical protein